MTKGKRSTDPVSDIPLNPPDVPVAEKERELEGRSANQAGYFDQSEVEGLDTISTDDIREDELETGMNGDLPNDTESLDLLTEVEMRDGETDDPMEAAQEGLTYIPPINPPALPTNNEDSAAMGAFGVSPAEDEYNSQHALPDDEVAARVREAFRADSSTTEYAERVRIHVRNGVVRLRGVVHDLDDSDNLVAVASEVEGVVEAIDDLRVRGLG